MPRIGLRRALAHRNFRLFLCGQGISLVGTWMQQLGLSWLVFRLTGSASLLGLVGFCTQIPIFFLAPLAGVLADRWNRHRAILVTQVLAMAQAGVLAGLTLTDRIEIWQILVLSVLLGVINAFDMPLRQSFFAEMVTNKKDLPNAIALNSSIVNAARLLGPSLGGLVISIGGEKTCFAVNAVSYLAVLAALGAMRDLPKRTHRGHPAVLHGLADGLRYAAGSGPIRWLLLLMGAVSVATMPMLILMPVIVSDVFHAGPQLLGFLLAASGLGALASAAYLALRRHILGLARLMTIGTAVLGLAMVGFATSKVVWISLGLMFVNGFCLMFQMAVTNTLLQTVVDEDKRGRVMSLYTIAVIGTAPLGSLLGGTLAEHFSAPLVVGLGGAACLLGAGLFALNLPRLREQIRPIYRRIGILPPVAEALQASAELSSPPETAS